MVGEQLQGNGLKNGEQQLVRGRDVDDVIHVLGSLVVSLAGYSNDWTAASTNLLDV
jgi:hypothetical protein